MSIKVYSPQDIYDSYVYKVIEDENLSDTINSYFPNWLFKFNKLPTRVKIKQHSNERINKDCIEALKEVWRDRRCTIDELWYYSKICCVQIVIRPYLEMLVN